MSTIERIYKEEVKVLGLATKDVTVEAEWTGDYPNLCSGSWNLVVNGIDCNHILKEAERLHAPMETGQRYSRWYFNAEANGDVERCYFESGMPFEKWRKYHKAWLDKISKHISVQKLIFRAILPEDWTHRSCGGCI